MIHYKSEYGDWQETQVNAKLHKHLLTNLICGNHYQVTITAFNAAGRGLPSDTISAETTGRGEIVKLVAISPYVGEGRNITGRGLIHTKVYNYQGYQNEEKPAPSL